MDLDNAEVISQELSAKASELRAKYQEKATESAMIISFINRLLKVK